MPKNSGKYLTWLVLAALAAALAWVVTDRLRAQGGPAGPGRQRKPTPVEAAAIRRGAMEMRRGFSGALEAGAKFVVAPKVGGRVKSLVVDLGDPVKRGQVVARLEDDEYVQAVAQAKAEVAVAAANLAEAGSALEIAQRELGRVKTLRGRGVASEAQLDEATAAQLAAQAKQAVAQAQAQRARSELETANIRLGYTLVTADWSGDEDSRVVAERYVDEGETVTANAPLLSIVELSPITGVVYVTERDYGRLQVGQDATLATDAFPDRVFRARVDRIAPVFRQATRQARVELAVDNPHGLLKPGMFIRATVVLAHLDDVVMVPEDALAKRGGADGVFVVDPQGPVGRWRPVTAGVRQDGWVQVEGEGLTGQVVTLGQHLLDDGAPLAIVSEGHDQTQPPAGPAPGERKQGGGQGPGGQPGAGRRDKVAQP